MSVTLVVGSFELSNDLKLKTVFGDEVALTGKGKVHKEPYHEKGRDLGTTSIITTDNAPFS